MIRTVIFDFGGVVAEEGFREGLQAIAAKNGLDPGRFFSVARELIYETEYVTGLAPESAYWDAVRRATGIRGDDEELAGEIIGRFIVRPYMLDHVDHARSHGMEAVILKRPDGLARPGGRGRAFLGALRPGLQFVLYEEEQARSTVFDDVAARLARQPAEIFFADDDGQNAERAASRGWQAIAFQDVGVFGQAFARLIH